MPSIASKCLVPWSIRIHYAYRDAMPMNKLGKLYNSKMRFRRKLTKIHRLERNRLIFDRKFLESK